MKKISPIKKRILQFIENQEITKAEFCRNTNISYENFKGNSIKSDFGGEIIGKIITIYNNINPEWLLTGNGEMLKSEKSEMPDCSQCEKLQRMEMELERERCINNKLCGYEPGKKSAV